MGQGSSAEAEGTSSHQLALKKFSASLPPGLHPEEQKARYEKEIARLLDSFPEGGQDKFKAELKGSEKADLSEPQAAYKEVSFDSHQLVYQVHKDGQAQRTFKKMLRSKPDLWRKHGPVKKLCEIGGKSFNGPPGGKPKYFEVKPGTTPPPDPPVKPLLTVDDYKPFGGLAGVMSGE